MLQQPRPQFLLQIHIVDVCTTQSWEFCLRFFVRIDFLEWKWDYLLSHFLKEWQKWMPSFTKSNSLFCFGHQKGENERVDSQLWYNLVLYYLQYVAPTSYKATKGIEGEVVATNILFRFSSIQFLDSSYVHRSISRSRNWSRLKTGRLRNTGHNLILYSLWLLLQPYPLFLMLLQPHPLFCMLPRPYPLILMLLQPYPLFLRLLQPHPPLYVANLPQLVMRIRICIIKVGSASVWRDTNPDPGTKTDP